MMARDAALQQGKLQGLQYPNQNLKKEPNILYSKRRPAPSSNAQSSQQGQPPSQNEGPNASDAEMVARDVASQQGKLQGLQYPWMRFVVLNFDQTAAACDPARQQESPFYFEGSITGNNATKVFCKVWRQGYRKTDRKLIAEEIKYLKLANDRGIPSPKVIEDFTALDVVYTHGLEKYTYHLLVTEL
jgi:hypothetical protein